MRWRRVWCFFSLSFYSRLNIAVMPRPFDTTYGRRGGTLNENASENEDTKVLERSFKNRGLNSNSSNNNSNMKSDLLLRNKNVNQVLSQQRSDATKGKGKQHIDTPKKSIVKKQQTKSSIPQKRPISKGNSPISKRADTGLVEKSTEHEIEQGFQPEQELPYIPDDITPFDLDLFDGTMNMDVYETTAIKSSIDDDKPIDELESFPTIKRQFQQTDDAPASPTLILEDDKDHSHAEDICFSLDQPLNEDTSTQFPSEIEFCPSSEEELPFEPEVDQVDLSVFTPAVNLSAYDLSKYFDDQVEFFDDLYDDEDLVVKKPSLINEYGITLDDLSIFFGSSKASASIFADTLCDQDDDEIDYDEIPFSNHIMEELPLVN
ncbi:hypothetical protein BCR42DRAFT_486003 [Absidia repens]|uniref:Uncharacterized protein n=1 Tax=Absidia repens TaxID=90262 RepID=A0A1X2J265_9FUNG|nr:hypothetical protein BCR42DRAFT_486003 [Absidia repens]